MSSLNHDIISCLRKVFGFNSFKVFQKEIIQAILTGHDIFVIMPAGAGKSLCYQLPAYLLKGACIVISPFISKMKDQTDSANNNGLKTGCLNSIQTESERDDVLAGLKSESYDLLYVSPDYFTKSFFLNIIRHIKLCLFVVDEAYCISELSPDFIPKYRNCLKIFSSLPDIPVAAFTATANHKVQIDIINKLKIKPSNIIRTLFNRSNLVYRVIPKNDINKQILDILNKHPNRPGIIFRTTIKNVENTVNLLAKYNIKALPIHKALTEKSQKDNLMKFNHDKIPVIVTTISFPIDIEKSNIRFIVHGDLPKNMGNYYQETAHAGRDGEYADCVLLYKREDILKTRYLINQISVSSERQHLLKSLNDISGYIQTNQCRRRQILRYFGEKFPAENCCACDICLGEVEKIDATTDAELILSTIKTTGNQFEANLIIDIITGSNTVQIRKHKYNELKIYGIGRDKNKKHWWQVIDNLVAQKYLIQTEGSKSFLKVSPKAHAVRKGVLDICVVRQKKKKKIQHKSENNEIYTIKLFEKLRILRRRVASIQNVSPYIVFSDRTLHEMAHYHPTTAQEMSSITGVGEIKMKRYGIIFLKEIIQFNEKYPDINSQKELNSLKKNEFISLNQIRKKTINETIEKTWRMLKDGFSVEQISSLRGLTVGSIIAHIERLILSGKDININLFISNDKQIKIEKLFIRLNTNILSEIVNASKGSISYDEARLVRAILKKAGQL
jgi:ATP-dependent DNA helicase RecQ